ncbi:major facilitator superfamily-related transporter, putative [Plasmodium ovale]|uniref:Major facilitator superfamily-related transporter, putative n=1 Tax=Plasmodium ovale TaxID=36330 RepID=A0A1D3U7M7_PLAOA|nr:major facilitator superfamily-related transporter, putative [Plasmodium ovale]
MPTETMKEDISQMKYNGSSGKNDLKVNKWVAVALYSIVASVSTFVHAGFSGWQPIVYKTGAFSELCGPNDEVQIFRVDDKISYKSCGNRDAAVNNLFTLSFFVHFFLSSVSGYVLDTFGEKICFLSGQIILTAAFVSLTFLKFSYVWYLFFLLLGVSADLSFIPLLKISKYFPGQESLIFGILGSARSTGFGVGLLLKLGFFYTFDFKENEFYILCLFYMFTCILYSFLVGIFIMPSKKSSVSNLNSEGATGSTSTDKKRTLGMLNEMDKIESGEKKYISNNEQNGTIMEKIKSLWKHPQKWEYLITLFICSSSMIRFDYFIKTNRSFFIWKENDLTTIFSLSTVLSFIPTPFFGYLAGKFGSVYSIITNNIFIFLTYVCILFEGKFFRMLAIFLFFFYISFVFSCFYCYVDEKFSKEHFGKLCGSLFAFSALCLVFNFYLTYLTNVVYVYLGDKKYFPVVYGMNVLGVITLLLCVYLKLSEKKKK